MEGIVGCPPVSHHVLHVSWAYQVHSGRCFELLKQLIFVSSLQDLVDMVNISGNVNDAQLVGTEGGEVVVPGYDWVSFFGGQCRKVPQIKQHHHFHFTSHRPGEVGMKL